MGEFIFEQAKHREISEVFAASEHMASNCQKVQRMTMHHWL